MRRLNTVISLVCILTLLPSLGWAGDHPDAVISYTPGQGGGSDYITGTPMTDPSQALGRPTIDTTGDVFNLPESDVVPVVPVYPAFRSFELVSLGLGGELVLRFDEPVGDDPRNPYGVDFIVFGNSFVILDWQSPWLNGDPSLLLVQDWGGSIEPGSVSVSQDGAVWHTFSDAVGPHADPQGPYAGTDGPWADVFAPTLGRVYDPSDPDPSLGPWNLWWSAPTDPTWPIDPRWRWSDLQWRSLAEIATLYEESAGGAGFDLQWLQVPGLDWVRYVRIANGGAGLSPEIDAVADVFPRLGDFDRDGDVDLADAAAFMNCFTGPGGERALRTCFPADFDADARAGEQDVDLDDFAEFVGYFAGPGGV